MTNPKPMKATKRGWKIFNRGTTLEIQDARGKPIVHWTGFDAVDGPESRKLANAKLMHAAPEMAAVLRADIAAHVKEGCCGPKSSSKHMGFPVWCDGCVAARSALRKAGLAAAIRGGGR